MAQQIVTPFAGGDAYADARSRCITLAEAWLGSGATSGVSTWGDYHTLINAIFTAFSLPTISDGNTGAQWRDKMNVLNDPEQVMASVALAWWSADRADLMTLVGSAVSSLRDIYHAYDVTQAVSASRPAYSATSFNGKPGLTFDGGDDKLSNASGSLLPIGATPCEIWGVADQTDPVANNVNRGLFTYGASDGNRRRGIGRIGGGVTNRARVVSGTGAVEGSLTMSSGDFSGRCLVRGRITATARFISQDDGAEDTSAGVPDTTATGGSTSIGSTVSASQFWKGQIRDILVTNALTGNQPTYITNLLKLRRAL